MLTIGLTGGIGSGKSITADCFAKLGVTVIDADKITHELVKTDTVLKKIIAHFGEDFLTSNGELDRSKLRQRIFTMIEDRVWLEKYLHPLILAIMQQQVQTVTSPYCILVIPLLLEKNIKNIDRVLVVDTPETLQKQRVQQRDNISDELWQAISNIQHARADRLAQADDVVYNDGNLEHLQNQVIKMHEKYLKLAR